MHFCFHSVVYIMGAKYKKYVCLRKTNREDMLLLISFQTFQMLPKTVKEKEHYTR